MNSRWDRARSGFGGYGRWKHGHGGVDGLWGYIGCMVMVWMSCEVAWVAWGSYRWVVGDPWKSWALWWVVGVWGLHGGEVWVIMWLHGWGVRESLSCIWAMERLWDGNSAWVVCMLCTGCVQAVCRLCADCAQPMCQSTHYRDLIIKSVSIKLPYSLLLLFVMLLKNFCIKTTERSCFPHPN